MTMTTMERMKAPPKVIAAGAGRGHFIHMTVFLLFIIGLRIALAPTVPPSASSNGESGKSGDEILAGLLKVVEWGGVQNRCTSCFILNHCSAYSMSHSHSYFTSMSHHFLRTVK